MNEQLNIKKNEYSGKYSIGKLKQGYIYIRKINPEIIIIIKHWNSVFFSISYRHTCNVYRVKLLTKEFLSLFLTQCVENDVVKRKDEYEHNNMHIEKCYL